MVPRRRDDEVDRRALFVPDTVIVRGNHAEMIRARAHVAVKRRSSRSRFVPRRVTTFQPISKEDFLRCDEAEGDVVDLDVSRERRQSNDSTRRIGSAIGDDLLDVYGRRHLVALKMIGIDHLQQALSGEPEPSVRRACPAVERRIARAHPVERVEGSHRYLRVGVALQFDQVSSSDFSDRAIHEQPSDRPRANEGGHRRNIDGRPAFLFQRRQTTACRRKRRNSDDPEDQRERSGPSRSVRKAAHSSAANNSGCSHAAKCPPLGTSWK